MNNNVEHIVLEEICKYFDIENKNINLKTSLSEFNADSLDIVQLGTNLEQIFDIDFVFKDVENFKNIEDVCIYIEREL